MRCRCVSMEQCAHGIAKSRESLFMTPVDSLDTLLLMGFNDEADKTRALIVDRLSFDKDISVK